MSKSLLFLPDISGFTEFVQSTEVRHSQHVIAELLEVLMKANTQKLQLAEVEGDALFYFKEEIPSLEKLLAQAESLFTAFYSHLELLKKNRICPCNACATAPNLQLKIVGHCGDIEFIAVDGKRKPFGPEVIQVHRLMKNSVESDNYVLFSRELTAEIGLEGTYKSKLFMFEEGRDHYDGVEVAYLHSHVEKDHLKLKPFEQAREVIINRKPTLRMMETFNVPASELLEGITNYAYRHAWSEGVDRFEWSEEVTRAGTEHVCVVNGKHLNFVAVVRPGEPGQLVYGEQSPGPSIVDQVTQFFVITPLGSTTCRLETEVYLQAKSPIKKLMIAIVAKKALNKALHKSIGRLKELLESGSLEAEPPTAVVARVA